MKTKLLALTGVALMLSAAPALAGHHEGKDGGKQCPKHKMFDKMDADGNGSVSKAEFTAFHAKKFDKMDVDGDGVLTKEEKKAAWKEKREHMKDKRKERQENRGLNE